MCLQSIIGLATFEVELNSTVVKYDNGKMASLHIELINLVGLVSIVIILQSFEHLKCLFCHEAHIGRGSSPEQKINLTFLTFF